MKKPFPRRDKTPYTQKLIKMGIGRELYFPNAKMNSLKAIASRLGTDLGRVYSTRKEADGIICWRES